MTKAEKTGPKKYVIVGAGKMGCAIGRDLLDSDDRCTVLFVDNNAGALASIADRMISSRLYCNNEDYRRRVNTLHAHISKMDIPDIADACFAGADVAIGAAHYALNVHLAEAAALAKAHWCDLGGHAETVDLQLRHVAPIAAASGVALLPDCGIAPGAVSVIARYALNTLPRARSLHIRVGGLPRDPRDKPLGYAQAFSVPGLVANYAEPSEVLENGILKSVPSLSGLESGYFPLLAQKRAGGQDGHLEAFYTADGLGTLAKSLSGNTQLDTLDYKTLRYPGHLAQLKCLEELGMFESAPVMLNNTWATPRDMLAAMLERALPKDAPDFLVLRVAALQFNGEGKVFDLLVDSLQNAYVGLSAMQITTGFSAAICARMLADGTIKARGGLRHEDDVPPETFLQEWEKRGLRLVEHDGLPTRDGHPFTSRHLTFGASQG